MFYLHHALGMAEDLQRTAQERYLSLTVCCVSAAVWWGTGGGSASCSVSQPFWTSNQEGRELHLCIPVRRTCCSIWILNESEKEKASCFFSYHSHGVITISCLLKLLSAACHFVTWTAQKSGFTKFKIPLDSNILVKLRLQFLFLHFFFLCKWWLSRWIHALIKYFL